MNSRRTLRNDEAHQPWLAASFAGGVTDVLVTGGARRRPPVGSPLATLAVGGGSAPVSLLVVDPVDE